MKRTAPAITTATTTKPVYVSVDKGGEVEVLLALEAELELLTVPRPMESTDPGVT